MFLWMRVGGFTGLMKVRLKWVLSLPQLNWSWAARVNSQQTHAIMTHHASDIHFDTLGSPHLKSWNNLVLHIFSVFGKRQSQAVCFYCINSALKIKSMNLKGDLTGWVWHKLLKSYLLCHVQYVANKPTKRYKNDIVVCSIAYTAVFMFIKNMH